MQTTQFIAETYINKNDRYKHATNFINIFIIFNNNYYYQHILYIIYILVYRIPVASAAQICSNGYYTRMFHMSNDKNTTLQLECEWSKAYFINIIM